MPIVLSLLQPVIVAVTHAGRMLIEESRRTDRPRGADDKAEIDIEIEEYLADALTAIMPSRFVGEETGIRAGDGSTFCWLVDPHDGTRAWLQGHRGSAVSVALLRAGVPILGVVCSPMSPDRGWDLIAWAEGLSHILRNGAELRVDLSRKDLKAWTTPAGTLSCGVPAACCWTRRDEKSPITWTAKAKSLVASGERQRLPVSS